MNRVVRWLMLGFAIVAAVVVGAAALLAGTAVFALHAQPGDWSMRVAAGPLGVDLSVPALVRVATHPLGVRLLAGRTFDTRIGRLAIRAGDAPGSLVVRCAPCIVDARAVAARPVRLASVEVTVEHGGPNELHGDVHDGRAIARWQARLAARSADLRLVLPDTPVGDLVALFGDAVPEASRARIDGRAGALVRLSLPDGRFAIEPRIDGLTVDGLGTEALVAATPQPACARSPRGRSAAPFGAWLPKAVLAAEDQRFYEHAGYDVAEMASAWSSELPSAPEAARRRGASTLSQQLAKLLYTGDERSAARKVRELLYAAELDRVLGKARVLQLYLQVAPWGDGQCGGEAASLHYFGRHAASLDAAEAVWLASLLRHPEVELERSATALDRHRLQTLAAALRPMRRDTRDDLEDTLATWTAPPVVEARALHAGR